MELKYFQIRADATLKAALSHIEKNHHGSILVTSDSDSVIGLSTDGDIRRKLLEGCSLEEPVILSANRDFVWASEDTPRESLLKKLDSRIRIIPILDVNRHLVAIVSRDNFPIQAEAPVYARSRSPVRISFGGGGSDLTHYFSGGSGAVINTTISLYSHATLRLRDDEKIVINSRDLGQTFRADNLQLALEEESRFGLIQSLLKAVVPDFGFELYLHSDYPMNSGLGGSAAVAATVLGCFNQYRRDQWDQHELAEIAYQAERLYLGIAGGWQDQYATVFGGCNFMEFGMDQNIVHPLRLHMDTLSELEESLILCDTGTVHDSGDIHKDQRQQMQREHVRNQVQTNVELSYRMRNQLLRGRLLQFGHSLHEAWQSKRQLSNKISNERLDSIYSRARNHGAVGGKLLGAGGGGFFLFYVPPFRKFELLESLEDAGLKARPFRFEQEGLRSWTAREQNNQQEFTLK